MADDEKKADDNQSDAAASKPVAKPAPEKKKAEAPVKATSPEKAATRASVGAGTTGSPAAPEAADGMNRRGFLSWLTAGWIAFTAITLGTVTGLVRYLFPNVLFEPPQTFRAGVPGDFGVGEVSTRFKDSQAVWIVRNDTQLYVLSTVCTHLGCTPSWLAGEQKFKCPCHGSGFRQSGINFEGPAPRPLERYRVVLDETGQILVDKNKKFQYEKGEWSDPESFLRV